jgi:periplasmic protein TonB
VALQSGDRTEWQTGADIRADRGEFPSVLIWTKQEPQRGFRSNHFGVKRLTVGNVSRFSFLAATARRAKYKFGRSRAMGNSPLVRLSKVLQTTVEESWVGRVRQNARAFFELRGAALAHGGAGAFDLLEMRPPAGTRQRQAASLLAHVVVIGGLLWLGGQVAKDPMKPLILVPEDGHLKYSPLKDAPERQGSGKGAGGAHDQLPPTVGDWASRSQMVLIHPRLPKEEKPALPIEPTVFDSSMNDVRHVVLGLPSMKQPNGSNGQNGDDGMGDKPGHSMGTTKDDGVGETEYGGPPVAGAYPVKCVYCPDPEYTDEARHEKLQGSVTLRVLVMADGRAGQVRIVRGLGLGLDERAVDMVRKWRFEPARDASRKAIAEWVTVEATYRLF